MPRKKKPPTEAAPIETTAATAVAEPETKPLPPTQVPEWIDGPHAVTEASADEPTHPAAKNWGEPYKAIFTSQEMGFEMGENRRFRQRVFKFTEKPADDVLAALKENGFSYRAAERAWTIQATPDTRRLSDELAREFAGRQAVMFR